ncbi:hypothetical protein ACN08Y_07925 [Rothia sp. P5764]|uniref:hypothetical protein n=1 Tax=Rothia sp. P5764 TaxID=3402654 RepID=UPI003AD606C8
MLSYTDLNEIEKHHYTAAAHLTAAHYLYPLLLQDLNNVDDLRERYLRTVSRAELGYKTPYGLKANLEKLSKALREQSGDTLGIPGHYLEEGQPLHPIISAIQVATSYGSTWKSPCIWGIGYGLNYNLTKYLIAHHSDELENLSQTFTTIHEWYYNSLTGQADTTKPEYLTLLDTPATIGWGYPVILSTNPDPAILEQLPKTVHLISRNIKYKTDRKKCFLNS